MTQINEINDKHTSYSLGSLKAACHAANNTDRPVSSSNDKFSRRQQGKTGDALAESLLLWTDNLERIRDHVDGKDVARCRATVEILIVRRYLDIQTAWHTCSNNNNNNNNNNNKPKCLSHTVPYTVYR